MSINKILLAMALGVALTACSKSEPSTAAADANAAAADANAAADSSFLQADSASTPAARST